MGMAWGAVERMMKLQEVICRALAGSLTWLQAADILGMEPRSLRRWRARYEAGGKLALYDRRHGPSPRKAPAPEVARVLRLYRERYHGWNVRHFHRFARREHGVPLSYSFVKLALQEAGLVRKGRARGRHRRRREPRPCVGELLHLDGSDHVWLTLCPDERQSLIAVIDDATKRLLYAQLWPSESTEAVLSALRAVCESAGLPMALYTDRASWAFYTRRAGERVDRTRLTQLGLRPRGRRRSRPDPLPPRRAHRRAGQRRHARHGAPPTPQTARAADLRGPAGERPPPSRWAPQRLARPSVPGALRRPRPGLARPRGASPQKRPRAFPLPSTFAPPPISGYPPNPAPATAPQPDEAWRGGEVKGTGLIIRWAAEARIDPWLGGQGTEEPRTFVLFRLSKTKTEGKGFSPVDNTGCEESPPSTRLPGGRFPRDRHPERTDHMSKPSGHFTC